MAGIIRLVDYSTAKANMLKFIPEYQMESILTNENMESVNALRDKVLHWFKFAPLTMENIKALKIVLKFILQNY